MQTRFDALESVFVEAYVGKIEVAQLQQGFQIGALAATAQLLIGVKVGILSAAVAVFAALDALGG